MNGKRAKKLRKTARSVAREPSVLLVHHHSEACVTAVYPKLSQRHLYQRLKGLLPQIKKAERGAV